MASLAAADSTPATATAASPSMAQVLEAMCPNDRKMISAAFDDMNAQLDTTKKENEKLSSQYAQIEQASAVDKQLLSSQIDTFLSQLDSDTKQRFNITQESCRSGVVEADDPSMIRRNVDRLLMCCNAVMMARHDSFGGTPAGASGGQRPAKRKADDSGDLEQEMAGRHGETAAVHGAEAGSPAAALRAALNLF